VRGFATAKGDMPLTVAVLRRAHASRRLKLVNRVRCHAAPGGYDIAGSKASTDDLDAAHERAREAGCRELTDIEVRPWGERSFYAHDPFENPICFVDSQTLFTGDRDATSQPT
jgi:hypothetical protein